MRVAAMLALLVVAARADDPKRVAELLQQANAEYGAAKETWNKLVFTPQEVTDDEIAELLARYDKAIDLCQKACETTDVPEANTMVLRLARRTAQLRATAFAREMARKAAAAREAAPAPGAKPADAPEEPTGEEAKPEVAPETPEAPPDAPAPVIVESKEQRSRGMQAARNFLLNVYFANRKRDALVDRCATCGGRGKVRLPILDKKRRAMEQDCGGCAATGYILNEPVARKGFWLCWSPAYRMDPQQKTAWDQDLATYKGDPRTLPEFLTRVRIVTLDYQGLWADATWEEGGTGVDGKKFSRTVTRKLIRAGRQWFFFDPEHDKDLLAPGALEADRE
jgi:hypothetical protein